MNVKVDKLHKGGSGWQDKVEQANQTKHGSSVENVEDWKEDGWSRRGGVGRGGCALYQGEAIYFLVYVDAIAAHCVQNLPGSANIHWTGGRVIICGIVEFFI